MLCFYIQPLWGYFATIFVFVVAALTDWLDGFVARSMHQTSKFGAFLDPVADKLLVVAALTMIVSEYTLPFIAIPALIIICREIIVSALREWMAKSGKSDIVAVSGGGKIKTTAQLTAIIWLLFTRQGYLLDYIVLQAIGYLLLYVAAGLSVLTVISYARSAIQSCKCSS